MQTINQTTQTVSVKALVLADLLAGASSFSDSGRDAMPALNSVALSVAGGVIKVTGTDRYRLLIGEATVEDEAAILDQALIRLGDVKAILADLKALKSTYVADHQDVILSRIGDLLSVKVGGSSRSITLTDATFPPTNHLFAGEKASTDEITFNPAFMATIAKIPTDSTKGQVTVQLRGKDKPMSFSVPHANITWRGLIMPMKLKA